jgi:hypothetical protein
MKSKENFSADASKTPEKIKGKYLASPIGPDPRTHLYEIEYERTGDVVKIVPGSVKDLGPVSEEEEAKIKAEEKEKEKSQK